MKMEDILIGFIFAGFLFVITKVIPSGIILDFKNRFALIKIPIC
jgi:hypothetical protein